MKRRDFLKAALLAPLAARFAGAETSPAPASAPSVPLGKAKHCIFLWLGGGMAQVDTFDPKKLGHNKTTPKVPGSLYDSIETTVPGIRLCEHLSQTAKIVEHLTIVRTVNHHVIDEHAFATNLVHTGRLIGGSVIYPSIG